MQIMNYDKMNHSTARQIERITKQLFFTWDSQSIRLNTSNFQLLWLELEKNMMANPQTLLFFFFWFISIFFLFLTCYYIVDMDGFPCGSIPFEESFIPCHRGIAAERQTHPHAQHTLTSVVTALSNNRTNLQIGCSIFMENIYHAFSSMNSKYIIACNH